MLLWLPGCGFGPPGAGWSGPGATPWPRSHAFAFYRTLRWSATGHPLPLEPFFEPQNVAASIEKDANVIILPYLGPGLLWQWQSGMHFTQSGGYPDFAPRLESLNWPVVTNLLIGTAGPHFENDLWEFCVAHRVSAILVGPGTPAALVAAISALHWQETNNHGVRVVRVPDPDSLHFHRNP